MSELSSDRDPIEVLADSFLARFRRGERPSVEDYAAQHPDLADEIRELLPALVMLERDKPAVGPATATDDGPHATASGPAPHQLGDYLIVREIGRGGMGVVYEAVQHSLGRHVALKVLPNQALAGSSQLARFQLEARAAARLHHTNIVPVFGVGECEGVHYYAMQFITGQALDVVIDALDRAAQRRWASHRGWQRNPRKSRRCRSDPDRRRDSGSLDRPIRRAAAGGAAPARAGSHPDRGRRTHVVPAAGSGSRRATRPGERSVHK